MTRAEIVAARWCALIFCLLAWAAILMLLF